MSSSTSKAEPPEPHQAHLFDDFQRKHPKLISQTAINFAANAFSAAFGLLNVVIFTRLLSATEYGIYALGLGFSAIVSTFMCSWIRLHIMRVEPRNDGTDVRATALPGLLLSCLVAPFAYLAAQFAGLHPKAAFGSVALAVALSLYDTTMELLRARFLAFSVMRATLLRSALLLSFGVVFILLIGNGAALLLSAATGYFVVTAVFTRQTWWGTVLQYDRGKLLALARAGTPITLSLTLLAVSATVDRFIIAHLAGAADAGKYSAGVDLVRQTLIIPAISAAATFMPMAVQILANKGKEAAREHLIECLELLLAITLPAALGFATVSHQVADIILGPDFRETAATVMPIICVMMIFQILTYQYVHIGFLLSDRNSLYLINTASTMIFNCVLAYIMIIEFGPIGAAWSRLGAELFGFFGAITLTRWAFPVPLPLGPMLRVLTATMAMVIVVKILGGILDLSDRAALLVLIPIGMICYGAMCWALNVAKARQRLARAFQMVQGALAAKSGA